MEYRVSLGRIPFQNQSSIGVCGPPFAVLAQELCRRDIEGILLKNAGGDSVLKNAQT